MNTTKLLRDEAEHDALKHRYARVRRQAQELHFRLWALQDACLRNMTTDAANAEIHREMEMALTALRQLRPWDSLARNDEGDTGDVLKEIHNELREFRRLFKAHKNRRQ